MNRRSFLCLLMAAPTLRLTPSSAETITYCSYPPVVVQGAISIAPSTCIYSTFCGSYWNNDVSAPLDQGVS